MDERDVRGEASSLAREQSLQPVISPPPGRPIIATKIRRRRRRCRTTDYYVIRRAPGK